MVNYIKKRAPRVFSCGFSLHYKRKTEREGVGEIIMFWVSRFWEEKSRVWAFLVVVYLLLLHLLHGLGLEGLCMRVY